MATSTQDPFYIVADEIQDSINKLQMRFHRWGMTSLDTVEHSHLTKELLESCGNIEWQVAELDKAITVAARDPMKYGLDETELANRRKWTSGAHKQVAAVETSIVNKKNSISSPRGSPRGITQDIRKLANHFDPLIVANDGVSLSSESDKEQLLTKKHNVSPGDISSCSHIADDVGIYVKDEIKGQERLHDGLSLDITSTSNRMEFLKKRATVLARMVNTRGKITMVALLAIVLLSLLALVLSNQ